LFFLYLINLYIVSFIRPCVVVFVILFLNFSHLNLFIVLFFIFNHSLFLCFSFFIYVIWIKGTYLSVFCAHFLWHCHSLWHCRCDIYIYIYSAKHWSLSSGRSNDDDECGLTYIYRQESRLFAVSSLEPLV